jgi:hypothetical protein
MPDPATGHGDYCFECYEDLRYKHDEARCKEWIAKQLPTMQEFYAIYAKHCKIPVTKVDLEGNCHAAATALVNHLKTKGLTVMLKRGHWLGSDHREERSHFIGQQHSWLQITPDVEDNNILFFVDPTQFIFTGHEPAIAITSEDDRRYDAGGYALKEMVLGIRKCPARKGKTKPSNLSAKSQLSLSTLPGAGKRTWTKWTDEEMRFVANQRPESLGAGVKEIFQAIIDAGNPAAIPIDARNEVLGEH